MPRASKFLSLLQSPRIGKTFNGVETTGFAFQDIRSINPKLLRSARIIVFIYTISSMRILKYL